MKKLKLLLLVCAVAVVAAAAVACNKTQTFTVAVPSGIAGGAVTADKAKVEKGGSVTLTVAPQADYYLKALSVNDAALTEQQLAPIRTGGSYTVADVQADIEVKAEFAAKFLVTLPQSANGRVTADKARVEKGGSVVLTVAPDEEYMLSSLSINGGALSAQEIAAIKGGGTYTVADAAQDIEVAAAFAQITYTVTLPSGLTGGGITADKGETAKGGSIVLTVAPTGYYILASMSINGTALTSGQLDAVRASGTYTIANITQDVTVEAAFAIEQITLSFNYYAAQGGLSDDVTQVNQITVNKGSAIAVLPKAVNSDSDYVFLGWYSAADGLFTTSTTVLTSETLHAAYLKYSIPADTILSGGTLASELTSAGFTNTLAVNAGWDLSGYQTINARLVSSAPSKVAVNGLNIAYAGEGNAVVGIEAGGKLLGAFSVACYDYTGFAAVSSKSQLEGMSQASGTSGNKYVLTGNIDFAGAAFARISNFYGILDGHGFKVGNFALPSGWNAGIMTFLQSTGVIRNIAFTGVKGPSSAAPGAGLVSLCLGKMENVFLGITLTRDGDKNGGVTDQDYVTGTLASTLSGTLTNCIVQITSDIGVFTDAGAIFGYGSAWGTKVTDCYAVTFSQISGYAVLNSAFAADQPWIDANYVLGSYETLEYLLAAKGTAVSGFGAPWSVVGGELYFGANKVMAKSPEWIVKSAQDSVTIGAGRSAKLNVTVYHNGITTEDYTASYVSGDGGIVSVTSAGIITGEAGGSTTITVTVGGVDCVITVNVELQIFDKGDFLAIASNLSGSYKLMDDIDLEGGIVSLGAAFSGVLDGNGHRVYNFKIPDGWDNGMFKELTSTGVIRNVAFTDVKSPSPNPCTTGLVSVCNGLIENVYLEIVITADGTGGTEWFWTGGTLAGNVVDGTIRNCVVKVTASIAVTHYGSLVCRLDKWVSVLANCYVLTNLSIPLVVNEAATGIIDYMVNIKSFATASALLAANFSTFGAVWDISAGGIMFGGEPLNLAF